MQQAESFASQRHRGASKLPTALPRQDREASVRPEPAWAPTANRAPLVHDRLGGRCLAQGDHDGAAWGYQLHRGGRYDSGEDHSPSPGPPSPRVFSKAVRSARFPARFRQPANLSKYSGETNPELWLADYRLACQLGGADDDLLIIRNLPLFLSDSAL